MINRIRELAGPLLAGRHAELVELTCRFEGSRTLLRFLVDTAGGIHLNELNELNRAIGALIDEHELIPSSYTLEVSSPGLDRPLKTPLDFERVIGRRLKVSTLVPIRSRQEFSGELVSAGEESIFVRLDTGDKVQIQLSEIARATQEIKL